MGLTSKAFSDIITFSRASNATRIGPDGKVAYAPHNLLTYSQAFTNAAWGTKSGTFTDNAAAAPDGTVTATKWVAVSGDPYCYQSISLSAATHTLSLWIKAEGAAVGKTGTLRFSSASTTVTLTSSWQRVSYTYATNATTYNVGFELPDSGAATGDTVYIWGAQLSVGSIAGDYTPTTSAAVYGPRFDYDPVTLAAKGLLIEEQRTNLTTYSEAFDNAAWSLYQAAVSANSTAAPDGTTTADTLTPNNTFGQVYQLLSKTSSAITYTISCYIKAGTSTSAKLAMSDNATGEASATFNLTTGTASATNDTWSSASATITAVNNGWYRCTLTATSPANTGLVPKVLNTGGNGLTMYIWGVQLEAGAFATSYIPTVSSTVTRSADVASVNTLSPWYNATEGTLFAQYDEYISSSSITNQVFASLNDGTSSNEMLLYRSGGGFDARFAILTSGALQADVATSVTIAQNTAYKTAGAYKLNDIAASTSGNTPGTDTSATIPTVSALQIGGGRSTTAFSGHIRRLAYYPRRLTNAELQALTA